MTNIDDIASEIAKQVELYTSQVEKKVRSAENKVTKEAVDELIQKSPKSDDGGGYAQGWTKKRVDGAVVIYNKTKPGLAHLLEHGHANVDGGRTPAQVHIRPVEDRTVAQFTELVEKAAKP